MFNVSVSDKRGFSLLPLKIWDSSENIKIEPIDYTLSPQGSRVYKLTKHIKSSFFAGVTFPVFTDDTTLAFPDPNVEVTSVDGYTDDDQGGASTDTWATARGLPGDTANDTGASLLLGIAASGNGNNWSDLYRVHILFDTSAIPDTHDITSSTVAGNGAAKSDGLGTTPAQALVTSAPATDTAIVAGDHDGMTTTLQSDTQIAYADFTVDVYNAFPLNATGLASISKTGITKFGVRPSLDLADSPIPSWSSNAQSRLDWKSADTEGTSTDPYILVEHSEPVTASAPRAEVIWINFLNLLTKTYAR